MKLIFGRFHKLIFGNVPVKVKMTKQVTYCTSSTWENPTKSVKATQTLALTSGNITVPVSKCGSPGSQSVSMKAAVLWMKSVSLTS